MYNNYNETGDYYVNTFMLGASGNGSATSPFKTIAEAINAVGSATGKKIVISGGGFIQENATKIQGVLRTNPITFYFDGGYAKTDMSLLNYFVTMSFDAVYNMEWVNGLFVYSPSIVVSASNCNYYNCVFDSVVFSPGVNYAINYVKCVMRNVTYSNAGYQTIVRMTQCVLDNYNAIGAWSISAVSTYVTKQRNGSLAAVTSIADCCCLPNSVVSEIGYTIVSAPAFVDPIRLRYNSLEGSSLVGMGSVDQALNTRQACGLPGVARKSLSTDPAWDVANGALYDNIEPDGDGGFRLVAGAYYGTVTSAPVLYDKYTLLNTVKLNISTVIVDNKPLVNSDIIRAEHTGYASSECTVINQLNLSLHAIGIFDYYVGMTLHVLSGAGTAGQYEITSYDHINKVVTLLSACGATDTTTKYAIESRYVLRYDYMMRFCGRGEDINQSAYAGYEINTPAYYSVTNGVISGNADASYVHNARRQPVGTTFQFRIAINNREYGV